MTILTAPKTTSFSTRATRRQVERGSWIACVQCSEAITFTASEVREQAICNIYDQGRWQRVEHFHAVCYEQAGFPHGPMLHREPPAFRQFEN